jgi:rod shape-determining protein MreC
VVAGQPVIDDKGIVGQITRTFVKTSELTLLTDRDQAIPVQITRNGLRSIAYGGQEPGMLDLRFMAGNADVQPGDILATSGIDGLYPAGLPVARVVKVERSTAQSFARILCVPIAGLEKHRHVLVLLVKNDFPPPPAFRDQESRGDSKRRPATDKAIDRAIDKVSDTAPQTNAPASEKPNDTATAKVDQASDKPAEPALEKTAPNPSVVKPAQPAAGSAPVVVPSQSAANQPATNKPTPAGRP